MGHGSTIGWVSQTALSDLIETASRPPNGVLHFIQAEAASRLGLIQALDDNRVTTWPTSSLSPGLVEESERRLRTSPRSVGTLFASTFEPIG
jgi:hypothetical protein